MSIMYITEFADVGKSGGIIPVGAEPSTASQHISFTGTAGQSAAFQNNTSLVRIHVDGISSIAFGTNPTAVANSDRRMISGQTEYYYIPQGQAFKVSAVTST